MKCYQMLVLFCRTETFICISTVSVCLFYPTCYLFLYSTVRINAKNWFFLNIHISKVTMLFKNIQIGARRTNQPTVWELNCHLIRGEEEAERWNGKQLAETFSWLLKLRIQALLKGRGDKSFVFPLRVSYTFARQNLEELLCSAVSCPTVKHISLGFRTP